MEPAKIEGAVPLGVARETAQSFLEEINKASLVLIGTHLNPDGDAIGSALAMSHFLDGLGKPNEVLCHHLPPKNLEFLPGSQRIKHDPDREGHDLAIVLDLDSMERLGSTAPYFEACPRMVLIDHHVPMHAPGDLRIVDTAAPATALILARLLLAIGAKFTPDIATCLLTGIVTDTGSFRFRNTTPEAMHLAAWLLEAGGDLQSIAEEIYRRRPLAGLKLLGVTLSKMKLDYGNRMAWSVLTQEDFHRAGATEEDTEEFVNELLAGATVEIACLLREGKPGKIRCSLRSRGNHDVSAIAQKFGGGGHRNAAGCSFDSTPEEAERLVVQGMRECLASS